MLSLPLNKLWGAGEKTLDRLRKAGFRTTQQIYNKSEGLLQGIFGENTGSFLYNSVRGNKDLIFGQEAENHSISSEKTFEYDLTDRDAIETALLQLSHTVMFRLHRENVHSRTLALKIRYDDFTTVSIQQTGERNFSSVDDLFERCCILFYKKYNKESGIRLLGVAADKVEDNSIPSQKELFDFGEEKKTKMKITKEHLELLKPYESKPIVLGVRPSDVYVKGSPHNHHPSAPVGMLCEIKELLGDEIIVYGNLAGHKTSVKLKAGKEKVDVGDIIEYTFDTTKMYFFDKKSTKRIRLGTKAE